MKLPYLFKSKIKVCIGLLVLAFCFQDAIAQEICITAGADQKTGDKDGYHYELWNQNSKGTACMTLGSGALFNGRWSGIDNYLARRGLFYNQTKKHSEIGHFNSVYTATYSPGCETNGNSYMGVYGWTVEPLVEYYIVENWCNWNPSMDANAVSMGFHMLNGWMYQVVKVNRTNAPSIKGNANFTQYFSIKFNKTNNGTVPITQHFNLWESLGMTMGKMHEVSFLVEGYKSSGTFSFSKLEVTKSSKPVVVPRGVDITPTYPALKIGQTVQLTAKVVPADATDKRVYYVSDKPSIATVSSTGLITAKSAGNAYITAWTYDGSYRDNSVVYVTK